jgi:hypothetical protein
MRYGHISDLINNQINSQHRKLLRVSALYSGVGRFDSGRVFFLSPFKQIPGWYLETRKGPFRATSFPKQYSLSA